MRFVYDPSGIAQLEFGSADDFNAWVHDRTERVRREFPGSIREVGELGPLVIARWAIDTPRLIIDELAVELEDLVGLRFGLDG
ncbi:MAG TPA: hypothetical protein VLX92_04550, partial [Kofleriaceae bacterium]|nr:hypothetical protein [Kofleriaceae bacterium]